MKITFIGTSHGVPAPDRYCSAIMIEVASSIYFIDAGAPIIDELLRRGKDVNKVKAIFTTHAHGDHVNGILSYADLTNWFFKNASTDIYLTEQRLADAIKNFIAVTDSPIDEERVRFKIVDKDFVYQDDNIRLSLIPTKHIAASERPSYAVTVECEGKKVIFSGDLSYMLRENDVPSVICEQETDLFVCEMAHFGMPQIKPYLEKCKAKQVYFTHVYPHYRFYEIKAHQNDFDFPIYIAEDGTEITL